MSTTTEAAKHLRIALDMLAGEEISLMALNESLAQIQIADRILRRVRIEANVMQLSRPEWVEDDAYQSANEADVGSWQ